MDKIYADYSTSVTELKKSPTALLNSSDGQTIAILNHNKPAAYLVPAERYEQMLRLIENQDFANLANERLKAKNRLD
jgi:antitoxin StbD